MRSKQLKKYFTSVQNCFEGAVESLQDLYVDFKNFQSFYLLCYERQKNII